MVKQHVDNVHRKDPKVNRKMKMNLREIACGDSDNNLMAVY
jgi:hypothetical protein